jgi:quercetin dioxygenase-like cupin family protein
MENPRIDLITAEWHVTAPGARQKMAEHGGKRVRLVEFTGEFVEHEWCLRGHAGYVLEGAMEVALEGGTSVRFGPGDALVLRPGTDKHKARMLGPLVRLFLVEDA